jgi:hypothetical protein
LIKYASSGLTHGFSGIVPIKLAFFDHQCAAAVAVKPKIFLIANAPAGRIRKKITF